MRDVKHLVCTWKHHYDDNATRPTPDSHQALLEPSELRSHLKCLTQFPALRSCMCPAKRCPCNFLDKLPLCLTLDSAIIILLCSDRRRRKFGVASRLLSPKKPLSYQSLFCLLCSALQKFLSIDVSQLEWEHMFWVSVIIAY